MTLAETEHRLSPLSVGAGRPPCRVLVPYTLCFGGGVRRILGDGLPRLARHPALALRCAELSRNASDMAEMASAGVSVDHDLGIAGSAVLSYRTGWRRRADLLGAAPRMARLIWRMRAAARSYDVMYVHGYRELLMTWLATRASVGRPVPRIVWHCHGMDDGPVAPALAHLADRCHRVIGVSEDVCARLRELKVRPHRIRLARNAVDAEAIRRLACPRPSPEGLPARAADQVALLVACASLRPTKGVHTALEALQYLPAGSILWIAGATDDPMAAGYVSELRARIERGGLEGRVRFIGHRKDIYAVMARATAVLVPSLLREAFGLVAAESMALGVPVIVSDRGALPEVVGGGTAGLIFPAGDAAALADRVSRLASDRPLREVLTAAGRRMVEDEFSYDRWTREVAECLTS